MIRRLFAEAVGTFILVLSVGVSAGEPFAVGGSLLCAMCLTGFVSGAQFNPAITTGIILLRYMENTLTKKDFIELLLNIIVQFVSAILGALLGWAVVSYPVHFDITDGYMDAETFFAEMIYTVLIVSDALVIGRLVSNPIVCGGIIAMGVTAGDWAVGKISGGCFNPAIGFGINIVNFFKNETHLGHTWIYVLSPFAGGIIGAFVAYLFIQGLEEARIANKNSSEIIKDSVRSS
jgi:glycerol uptake facilitator-like aquaporin